MGRPLSHRNEPLYTRISEPMRDWVRARSTRFDMSESHFIDSLLRYVKKEVSPKALKKVFHAAKA